MVSRGVTLPESIWSGISTRIMRSELRHGAGKGREEHA